MLTPNAESARSRHSTGGGSSRGSRGPSPTPFEQAPAASLGPSTGLPVPPLETQASGEFSEDGPRSTVMRPSPREMPVTPNNLTAPGSVAAKQHSDHSGSPAGTPMHGRGRRHSRVIISDDPGGISLRRVSMDHAGREQHHHDDDESRSARSVRTGSRHMSRANSGLPPPAARAAWTTNSEPGSANRSPAPPSIAVDGAGAEQRQHDDGAEQQQQKQQQQQQMMIMQSMHEHMTPENPGINPSLSEPDFSVGAGPAGRRMSTALHHHARRESRMTTGVNTSSYSYGGSGAFGGEYGANADSEYGGSEGSDGEIRENTFAFIAVENDRLERERVIAIIDPTFLTWRHRWFCILEGRPHDKDEALALAFNMLSISFVVASCVIFCLQSLPANTNVERERGTDPYFLAETTCIIFFVIEAAWRVVCVPLSHLFTGFFAIDVVTILGYFADLFNDANALSSVSQAMRLLRVFRVFKLSRYSTSLQLVFGVLRNSFSGLSMLVMPLALVAVVFSASIYLAEIWDARFDEEDRVWLRPSGFPAAIQSMPDAIWFTFTTITTVGYGDVVPQTIVGKMLAVLLMFVGVLTLSFPNIVLGANLQVAFKQSRQTGGPTQFTRRIRMVGHAVAFIRRTQYWVAVRKAREAARAQSQALQRQETFAGLTDQGKQLAIRANYAFFPTHADFEAHRKPGVEPVRPSNLRHWTLRGVDPIHVLQTLLEVFSGVATASELYEEMIAAGMSGETRLKDVALTILYMSEARIVRAFVLERNTTHIVAALMEPAVSELLLHAERGDRQCKRSAEYARFVWKQTTGQLVPYTLSLLFNTYSVWSRRERYAEDGTVADLRLTVAMPEDVRRLLLEEEDAEPMGSSGNPAPATTAGALVSVRSTAIGARKRTARGDALAASIGPGTARGRGGAAPGGPVDISQGLALLHKALEDTRSAVSRVEST